MRYLISQLAAGICILAPVLLVSAGLKEQSWNSGCEEGVELRIVTDRTSYTPKAPMHVKFLVTNTGQAPLYLYRRVGQCSSHWGWLSLDLRDMQNYEVEHWGCAVDDFEMDTHDMVAILSDSKTGILLEHGETYGREVDYDLPKKKGTFRLHAEIAPVGLTEQQKENLAQHKMRVLRSTCLAPTVTITVK